MTARKLTREIGIWLLIVGLTGWWIQKQLSQSRETAYPNKPIHVVVPFPAGGGSDTFVRILLKGIVEDGLLSQPMVVINQGGGGGTIGSREVKNATPDGYTILCLHNAIITAKLSGTVDYGPEAFDRIALTGATSLVILVREDSPFETVNDLVRAAKERPNEVCFGANQGAPAYFAALQLERAMPGASFNIVSAKGGADRYASLIGGHLQAAVFSLSEYLDFRSPDGTPPDRNIRAIAVMSETRHEAIPDVMTCSEQGIPVVMSNANYWWAPKGTAKPVINRLADVFEAAMKNETVKSELSRLRVDPEYARGKQFDAVLTSTLKRFESVVEKKQSTVPNFVPWLAGITAIMLAWVVIESCLGTKTVFGNEAEATTKSSSLRRPGKAIAAFAILAAYVIILDTGTIPFAICTTLMVLTIGVTIMKSRKAAWPAMLQIALITGFGIEFVFTQVFVTALP